MLMYIILTCLELASQQLTLPSITLPLLLGMQLQHNIIRHSAMVLIWLIPLIWASTT